MKETVTEQRVVEEEREITICDYCRLITSEEVNSFNKVMLNPSFKPHSGGGAEAVMEVYINRILETDDRKEAHTILDELLGIEFDSQIDLCPHCTEDWFGDGPKSMIRSSGEE